MPNMLAKVPYWQALLDVLGEVAEKAAVAIGDFNSCRAYVDEAGAIDKTAHFFEKIKAAGFRDQWRDRNPDGREFSWYSTRGNGFRIDHAFLSRGLAARTGAIRYSHNERLAGISDHSLLILDIG
jgi:exodeoxyribonuclease-3